MSKTTLNPYRNKAKRIVNNLKALQQKEIAVELCVTQGTVSYGINKGYVPEIEKVLILMDLAGYEVREKEL